MQNLLLLLKVNWGVNAPRTRAENGIDQMLNVLLPACKHMYLYARARKTAHRTLIDLFTVPCVLESSPHNHINSIPFIPTIIEQTVSRHYVA